ncbi:MAG: hypothetical protein ACK4K4_05530, partial [Caldimicrobium sp.]
IKKNEETIQRAQEIINRAKQRTDENAKKAEAIARAALMEAMEAKRRNEETKRQWELKKIRADRAYATIENMISQNIGSKRQIKGFMTSYTGNVYIIKANGDKVAPENAFLEPGDKIRTARGTAEIEMLNGRASVKLGPYSEFVMGEGPAEEQIVELSKGKVYVGVEKIDEYLNKMRERLDKTMEDIKKLGKVTKQLTEAMIHCSKKWNADLQLCIHDYLEEHGYREALRIFHPYKIRCPTAVIGPRGTKFVVEVKNPDMTEIMVLEGSVEVSSLTGDKKVIVNEGYKVIVTKDGIEQPEKIIDIDKWWEK